MSKVVCVFQSSANLCGLALSSNLYLFKSVVDTLSGRGKVFIHVPQM